MTSGKDIYITTAQLAASATAYRYSTKSNTWATSTLTAPSRSGQDSFSYKGKIFLVGGSDNSGASKSISSFYEGDELNSAPYANAGANQTVNINSVVYLDASLSSDDNNDPLTYKWYLLMKPFGSSAVLNNDTFVNPSFRADVAGRYVLSLVVNDGKSNSDYPGVVITVIDPNAPL